MKKILNREDLVSCFNTLDCLLKQKTEIVLLGAASLLMLNIMERSTIDIDIANARDANYFLTVARSLGIQVDIVSISTTVDFNHCSTCQVFKGNYLFVYSVMEKDLIKLKLERYKKQDPDDIDEIIRKIKIPYSSYSEIVTEAARDYVGNLRIFVLSALMVAENHYNPEQVLKLKIEMEKIVRMSVSP